MTGEPLAVVPIGHVRTPYAERAATPVQTALNPHDEGSVVLLPEYADGTHELDGFDYAWLLTWLAPAPDDPVPVALRQKPFLLGAQGRQIGIFAMRGPRRPNPIGLHLVRVIELTSDGFRFAGIDMVDGTPLLDVKPWVAPLDLPHGHVLGDVRSGWFDEADLSGPHTPRSLRPSDAAGGQSPDET